MENIRPVVDADLYFYV